MTFRRGFKADANWYARSMRQELSLLPHDPLCPWKLAAHLGYVVRRLSEFVTDHPAECAYLVSGMGRQEFSAVTFATEQGPCIIHNDAHGPYRQAANLAHEVAHGLLMHKPAPLVGIDGTRTYNAEQEKEANWMGPALLISEESAHHIVKTGQAYADAQLLYGVSEELLRMRLGVTGALIRAARRRAA